MMATFSGATTYGGQDYAGVFGVPGASLAYKAASLTFTYDTEAGDLIAASGEETRLGGSWFGGAGPLLSIRVTVDGASYDFDPAYYGYASSVSGAWTWLSGRAETPGNAASEVSAIFSDGATGDLDAPISTYGYGDGAMRLYAPGSWGSLLAEADFEFYSLEVAYVGPSPTPGVVPEPATWALLIGGFGLAGEALRRRRRAIAA